MAGPFDDLPDAQPSATPVTTYSIPKSVGGADENYDSGTARGVGSSENELSPGIVAVNPSVHPIGTIFKDTDTNQVFIAADKHGNKNPNVVDIYTPPSQYTGYSGNRNLVPIGAIPSNQIPKTASGVRDLLSNYGNVPQGEGAYSSLGKNKSQDPFADLPDATNANSQFDPFADLPDVQGKSQTQSQAGGVSFAPSSYNLPPMGGNAPVVGGVIPSANSPQVNQQSQPSSFVNSTTTDQDGKRPVGFLEAAGRGLVGGLAKTNELMAQGIGIFPYVEDKTLQAFGINSDIYNRYMKAVHATGLGQPGVEAEAIKPTEELTTGGKIGLGLGEMGSGLPYMAMSGGIGAEEAAAQNAFQVVKPLMPRITESIQSMIPMAAQSGADAVQQSAQQGDSPITQAAKGIAEATTTAAIGAVPLSARSKFANWLPRMLEQGAYGYITGLPVSEQQKVVDSWVNGKPYVPSDWKEMAIQAIPMGLMTGAFGVLHAPEPPAPKLAPSANPIVNEREAKINAMANEQAEVPLTPEQQKMRDDLAKRGDQWEALRKQVQVIAQQLQDLPEDHPDRPALREKAGKIAQQMADLRAGKSVDIQPEQTQGDERFAPKPNETTGQNQKQETGGVSSVEGVSAETKPEGKAEEGTTQSQGQGAEVKGGEGETSKTTEDGLREAYPNTAFFDEATEAIQRLNSEDARTNKRPRFAPASLRDLLELKNNPAFKLADKLAGIFGKKIVFYKGAEGTKINGATGRDPALKNYIFLKIDGARPHLFTAGHELWHHIELYSPVLATDLRKQLKPLIKDWAGIEQKYKAAGYEKDRWFDEHIGDFLGDAMQDPSFWNTLARKNPKTFKELATKTVDWLNKLLYQLKDWKMGGDYTRDIEKARDMLAEGLNKFAQGKDESISTPEEGKGPMFQQDAEEKRNKDFYSQLQRTIADKMPNKASVEQIKAIIDPAKGSGVKPDELKWSNLEGFLENKKNVTKQEVLDYLKNEGSVKFEERTLQKEDISKEAQEYKAALQNTSETIQRLNNSQDPVEREKLLAEYRIAQEEQNRLGDILSEKKNANRPKFQRPDLVLPNGENYREVVLTMPEADKGIDPIDREIAKKKEYIQHLEDGGEPVDVLSDIFTPQEKSQEEHLTEARANLFRLESLRKQQPNLGYTSSHFQDIPNYVAHMRLDERKDASGKDGLFIEEIQSDRHQQGRKKGYGGFTKNEEEELNNLEEKHAVQPISNSEFARMRQLQNQRTGIPDAPFRKDWSVQMFKRALRDAIASGKEWIGWTSGDTQAERYDLSKQVDALMYVKKDDGTYRVDFIPKGRNGEWSNLGNNLKESDLADNIGKEIAEKIVNGEGEPNTFNGTTILRGVDLKVGGEGMKGFYDQILPKEIGKYVKKWGGKVEKGNTDATYYNIFDPKGKKIETQDTREAAEKSAKEHGEGYTVEPSKDGEVPFWKVEITPEMRESVSEEGQPMFQQDRPTEQEESKKRDEVMYQTTPVVKKTRNTIVNTFKRKPVKEAFSYMRDAGDNAANIYAKEQTNEVANDLKREFKAKKDKAAEALSFVIEAKGDQNELGNMRQKIENSPDASPKWKKKALAAIEFADNNFSRFDPIAQKYEQIGLHQVAQENANGIDTFVREGYVPHYQDLEEQELFGGSGTGSATGFRKMRTYDTFADSIANGIDPKSINAVDLLQKRLSSGQKSINYRSWIDSLKQTIDPASGDPIATKISITKRPDGSSYLDVPRGYHQETLAGQRVAIKDGYEGIISALNDPSAWRGKGGQIIQKIGGTGKAITLGLDTYHLGRIAIWQSLIKSLGVSTFQLPLPSYRKGVTLLDQSVPELNKMIAAGEIPKSWAKGILENKRQLNLAVKTGYNVGGISDALHQDWIHKIPGLGTFNSWLFNQFQRGAMAETWLLEFQRYRNAYPAKSETEVARMVSKDLNTRFGNLGRQGTLKSKTMQDTARFLFLAPQWNEGLIRTELGALGQTGQALLDAATGKRLFAGVLARSVGGMMAAQFIANQLINYATRGTPTWDNPEEGIGAKLSAWIPDLIGNGPGFFLNPMSLAMETTHLLMKGYERTGDALQTGLNYFRSRSSTVMRPVWSAVTNKNALGTPYAPGKIWQGMLQDSIPMPIAAGTIYSAANQAITGEPSEQFAGQYQKQLFSTFGVKLEGAPSDESRIYTLANHFKLDNNIQDRMAGYSSPYSELNHALVIGNITNAKNAMQKILETRTPTQVQKYYKDTYPSMRLLESKAQQKEFLDTLDDEQRNVYERAKDRRKDTATTALDLLKEMQ